MKNICVIHPSKNAYSETFIREHIKYLSKTRMVLSNGVFPTEVDGRELANPLNRLIDHVIFRTFGPDRLFTRRSRRLAKVFRKTSLDVVLAEYGPTGAQVHRACQSAGIPLVVHFHGQDVFERGMLDRFAKDYSEMFQTISGVIVGTEEMREKVEQLGAPKERVFLNPCGVDTDLFTPVNAAANPPMFVAVGRFVEKKAPQLTLLAFWRVMQTHPEAKLTMIGDGPLLDSCKQISKSLGMENSVVFTGALPQGFVAKKLLGARCFLQHSVTAPNGDSEGTSISVLEASASGLPVISTWHGGIKNSVIQEKTGFLVHEYNVEKMAVHMRQMLDRPDLAGQLGQRGRQRMVEKYAIRNSISRLDAILEQCMNGPKKIRHG